ncbi:MAG: hypothetical protein EBU01_15815, partial [Crocinitomicaceae bacterium]|nr:hypothetical protein [Crocinitomicaceae bacterium]
WKQKYFKFISYNEKDDYEIPENVLKAYILEIGKTELDRISNFSFGSDFCSFYVSKKFSNIEFLDSEDLKNLYQFIEYEKKAEQENRKHQLDKLYSQRIEFEIIEKANQLETIRTNEDYNKFIRLLQLIPYQLSDIHKVKITEAIHKIITKKCSDEFKPELWIKGIIENLPIELVSKYFFNESTQSEKRIAILAKLNTDEQFELLKRYSEEYTFEEGFILLEEFVKKENSLGYYFELSKVLYDTDFWDDKTGNYLKELFINYVNTESNDEQKYELFFRGYVKNVPLNIVLKNTNHLEKENLKKIFKNISENKSLIKSILSEKATVDNINSLSWYYDTANEFLDKENFNLFDKKIFETIEELEYFKLWETGKAKKNPKKQYCRNSK